MKAIFEEEKRKWNQLNENSVKFRTMDLDEVDEMEDVVFVDENNKKILDVEIYLPQDKAYAIINRVHYRGEEDKKIALKRMINYLLYPGNLNFLASSIYVNILGSGISREMAEVIGFYPVNNNNIYTVLNKNFEQFLNYYPIDEGVKKNLLQDYMVLKSKNEEFLDRIKENLENSMENLQFFTSEKNEIMVEETKRDIKHYEEMLGIKQKENR